MKISLFIVILLIVISLITVIVKLNNKIGRKYNLLTFIDAWRFGRLERKEKIYFIVSVLSVFLVLIFSIILIGLVFILKAGGVF